MRLLNVLASLGILIVLVVGAYAWAVLLVSPTVAAAAIGALVTLLVLYALSEIGVTLHELLREARHDTKRQKQRRRERSKLFEPMTRPSS
jgi:hypothetical protein